MAKEYYTLEETIAKLGSEESVRSLVRAGKIREFRDAGKLNYRIDEVDLLASDPGLGLAAQDSGELVLDDTGSISLELEPEEDGGGQVPGSSGSEGSTGPQDGGSVPPIELTGSGSSILALEESGAGPPGVAPSDTPNPALSGSGSDIGLPASDASDTGFPAQQGPDAGQLQLEETDTADAAGRDLSGSGSSAITLEDTGAAAGPTADIVSLEEVDKDAVEGMKKDDTVITNIGISVFDDDDLEIAADPMAKTLMSGGEEHLGLDGSGGGSGLLDLTRESDDTSLGAELLEGIDMGDTQATAVSQEVLDSPADDEGLTVSGTPTDPILAPDVSEPPVSIAAAPVPIAVATEVASPAFTGMLIAASLTLALAGATNVATTIDTWPGYLETLAQKFWLLLGGTIGLGVVFALIGFFIGKPSSGSKKPKAPKIKKPKKQKVKKGGKSGKDETVATLPDAGADLPEAME